MYQNPNWSWQVAVHAVQLQGKSCGKVGKGYVVLAPAFRGTHTVYALPNHCIEGERKQVFPGLGVKEVCPAFFNFISPP